MPPALEFLALSHSALHASDVAKHLAKAAAVKLPYRLRQRCHILTIAAKRRQLQRCRGNHAQPDAS
jgi:hypothetical protein